MEKLTREQVLLRAEAMMDLSGLDLSGIDLSGAELANIKFRDANLEGANLCEAVLTEAEFRDAKLGNADFTDAQMRRAVLIGADIQGACFDGANMVGVFLNGTHAAGASFKKADLRAARMGVPKCQPEDPFGAVTTFRGANMEWCLFGAADLTGVDLRDTNLTHAHLYESEIRAALLDGADLTEVKLKRQPEEYAT